MKSKKDVKATLWLKSQHTMGMQCPEVNAHQKQNCNTKMGDIALAMTIFYIQSKTNKLLLKYFYSGLCLQPPISSKCNLVGKYWIFTHVHRKTSSCWSVSLTFRFSSATQSVWITESSHYSSVSLYPLQYSQSSQCFLPSSSTSSACSFFRCVRMQLLPK